MKGRTAWAVWRITFKKYKQMSMRNILHEQMNKINILLTSRSDEDAYCQTRKHWKSIHGVGARNTERWVEKE